MVVMLGFREQKVEERHPVDWSTNKIGGLPNWVDKVDLKSYPRCNSCSHYMYHLLQVYCPLHNSAYHRTLNIFGCTSKKCWNKHESIVVIRSQKLEDKPVKEKKTVVTDDWGMNDWSNNGSNGDDDWGTPSMEADKYIKLPSENMVNATRMDLVDVTSQIDGLTIKESNKCHENVPHFTGYHIYVQAESNTVPTDSKDYEMKLYEEYVTREGDLPASDSKSKNKQSDCEKYEKTHLTHGDGVFHQFKKRISNHPEQLLRYEWGGAPLLLSNRSQIHPPISSVPNCSHCQSPRVFELQLMPGLVTCLHEHTNNVLPRDTNTNILGGGIQYTPVDFHVDDPIRVEFGCIYVFSCSKACWEGDGPRFEFAVVHPDPDVDVLKY